MLSGEFGALLIEMDAQDAIGASDLKLFTIFLFEIVVQGSAEDAPE